MIQIITFGYLHEETPTAHLTVDLRRHFRDPHIWPQLRQLTALDSAVRDTVLRTPGIRLLVSALIATVLGYKSGPMGDDLLTVAIGCAGGRHRAPTVGMELAEALNSQFDVKLIHRDLELPVVDR